DTAVKTVKVHRRRPGSSPYLRVSSPPPRMAPGIRAIGTTNPGRCGETDHRLLRNRRSSITAVASTAAAMGTAVAGVFVTRSMRLLAGEALTWLTPARTVIVIERIALLTRAEIFTLRASASTVLVSFTRVWANA